MTEFPNNPIHLSTPVPESPNKNVIAEFILVNQKGGHLKKCSHLGIDEPRLSGHGIPFRLNCRETSLYSFETRDGYDFHGCPTDCHFYEPKWKGGIKRFLSHCSWKWGNFIETWWTRYSQLSPWVQIAILILFIMLVLPAIYLDQLVESLAKLK